MSSFAEIVRQRVRNADASGVLARNMPRLLTGHRGKSFIEAGTQCLDHLTKNNGPCRADPRCHKVWQSLSAAYQSGTPGDARTALTQLQTLLRQLTEEDGDIGGDEDVQTFRRQLGRLLD